MSNENGIAKAYSSYRPCARITNNSHNICNFFSDKIVYDKIWIASLELQYWDNYTMVYINYIVYNSTARFQVELSDLSLL